MVQRNAFLANLNHRYRTSQHDCSANNKNDGDYYEHPSLSDFMNEH